MTVACPFRCFLVSVPWKNFDACDSGVPGLNCIYKISLQSSMNCESLRNSAEALSMVRTGIFGGCWKYDLSKVHLVASTVSWIHGLMIFDEHFYVGQLLLRLLPSGVLETSSPKWSSTTCRHRTLAVWSAAATKTGAEKTVFWMLFVGGHPGWRFFTTGRVSTIEVSLKHYVRNPHIEPTKKEKLESRSVCHHSKRRWLSSDLMLSRVYWRGKVDLFNEDRPQGVLEVFFQDRFPAALRHVDEGF